ncbi:thioredoxin family protein [Ramlibacter sp. AN1015]|uniref:thioredoxin family protein n=1 Tax=Ramlibacter sp. AN1015 TaxID=3133428 RepID=UPI0030BCD3E4
MSPDHETRPPADRWQVICLCADWCGTCRDWRAALARVARSHPQVRFSWVDIEDEADTVGEIDIETFPTLLIAQGMHPRFFGPVLPHPGTLERLLASLMADPHVAAAPDEAADLLLRLSSLQLKLI